MVPGAEVQLLDHESGAMLGTRLMDTGGRLLLPGSHAGALRPSAGSRTG